MIHPEHVETVAIKAYALFRAKHRKNPNWSDLPEATRIKWQDLVIDADKVRNKVTDVFQEQCVFSAVMAYHLPVEGGRQAGLDATVDSPPQEKALKPKNLPQKRNRSL